MGKQSAFGTTLGMGTQQVETATCAGTCTVSGDMSLTITSAFVAGSPLSVPVTIVAGDDIYTYAAKCRTALNLVAAVTLNFIVGGYGQYISLTRKVPAADEAALNIAIVAGTTGITADGSSDATTPGVATANIAYITSIGGPGLALDTVDVTTHDSPGGWEEVVSSILRQGELAVDLVYDPAAASHNFTASTGLGYIMKNKSIRYYTLTFPGGVVWTFNAWVTRFEASEPVDGALTAACTLKLTGNPGLA